MKRTLALGGVAAGLLATAAVALPAHADQARPKPKPLAETDFAAQQVAAFWFGENRANLRNATPYNVEVKASAKLSAVSAPSADSKPGTVGSSGDQKAATGKSKNVNLPRTVGKVFFIGADGKPHWCSATAVQSANKNLVATAGHCVYDLENEKATLDKWVFVPGYYQGKTPWGIYVGKQAFTHLDFSLYADRDYDYAFVVVYDGVLPTSVNGGGNHAPRRIGLKDVGKLGDNVGGQGLAYNQRVDQPVFVFGYPSGPHPDGNYPYTGKTMKYSYGKTFATTVSGIKADALVGVKSSFTGEGSLGSAWLYRYDNARRLGYLNGVTIAVADTDGNYRYDTSLSPYFDGETLAVYKLAASTHSGKIV